MDSPYMTLREAAEALGIRPDSLSRKIALGTAPAFIRPGRHPKFIRASVLAYRKPKGLSTKEAAKVLKVHPVTMQEWRARGIGPAYFRDGRRVFYRLADLHNVK